MSGSGEDLHDWLGPGTASCNRCGLVRMRRSGIVKFCVNGTSGPWTEIAPTCDARRSAVEVKKNVITLESLTAGLHVQEHEIIDAEFVDDGGAMAAGGSVINHGWRSRKILMGDVETSGLDWTQDDVVEIGLVVAELHYERSGIYRVEVLGKFQSLIRPVEMMLREDTAKFDLVREITGITREELVVAPLLSEVCEEIHEFIARYGAQDALFASYNAEFDQPFIASMFIKGRSAYVPIMFGKQQPHLDPYIWVQKFDKYVKGKGRHKLMAVAQRYGVVSAAEAEKAHRADFDAVVAMRVLAALCDRVPDDIDDLMDWQKAVRGDWAAEFFGTFMPRKRAEERRLAAEARSE